MKGLLIASGSSFVFLLMLFFCVPFHKPMKIAIIFIQINFILIYFIVAYDHKPIYINFYYKYIYKHSNNDYHYISNHFTIINYSELPIKGFDIILSDDTKIKFKFERLVGQKFKYYKEDEYTKQCLKNYFIKSYEECPITDIIIQKEKNNTLLGYNYNEKKFHNIYFYYTNNKLDGKIYTNIETLSYNYLNKGIDININDNNYYVFFDTKSYLYSNYKTDETNETSQTDFSENKEELINDLDFALYTYIICFILLSICFMYSFCEPWNSKLYNYYTVITWIIYIINMVLFIVRYTKIIKIKKLCYSCDETYLKYLKADMMPLALSIAIILIYILYLITPKECHFNHNQFEEAYYINKYIEPHPKDDGDIIKKNMNIFYLLYPLDVIFIVIFILVVINDNRIKNNYKEQNFKEKSFENENEEKNYIYLTTNFSNCSSSETNIYFKDDLYEKNGKICGKDINGIDLYVPKYKECPINDIYLGLEGDEKQGYSKIYCYYKGFYLFYTNTNTEGRIIESLHSHYYSDDDEDDEDDNYYDNYYYEKNNSTYEYYLGVNLMLENKNTNNKNINFNDTIKNLEENYINLKKFNIGKYILFAFFIIFIIFFSVLLILDDPQIAFLGCGIFILIFSFIFVIICIICLNYKIKYIKNVNSLLEINNYEKYGYIPDILLVILALYFFIYFIIILIYKFLLKDDCTCLKTYLKNLFKKKERDVSHPPIIIQVQPKKEDLKKNENKKENDNKNENEIKNERKSENSININYHDVIEYSININNHDVVENKPETEDKLIIKKSTFKNPCTICLSKESSVIISPCGHRCLCLECYNDMKAQLKICPICRKNIICVVEKVFDA